MLPSKDDDLHVAESLDDSLATRRDVVSGEEDAKASWLKQARRDLKPSKHRDT